MNLPSVIVSLVLFAICLPTMLAGYSRATATIWDSKAEQNAVAVAAWSVAEALEKGGCSALDDDNDSDNGYTQDVPRLAGTEMKPPNGGFVVSCLESRQIAWPPPVVGAAPVCDPSAVCVPVLSVTTKWVRLNGSARSLELTVLDTDTP